MGRLDGKIALITGGASGIGACAARHMVGEGAQVMLSDIDDSAGGALADELGAAAAFVHHDVRVESDWTKAVDATVAAFGPLNVLVNNAGIGAGGNIEEETLDAWHSLMAINSDGVFLGCKYAVKAMKEGGGSIINLSSVYGLRASAFGPAYSASKGAVRLLTKSVALYCAEQGYKVRCNSIHPGFVETPLVTNAIARSDDPEEFLSGVLAQHPVGRLGQPEDVAHGIVYLASDEADFVTGSELVIDGGFML